MSQCCDYEDINFYVINVFYGIVIAVYFLPFKKITLYISRNSLRASRSLVITGLGASWFRVLGHGYSFSQAAVSQYFRHSVSGISGIFRKSSRALRKKNQAA